MKYYEIRFGTHDDGMEYMHLSYDSIIVAAVNKSHAEWRARKIFGQCYDSIEETSREEFDKYMDWKKEDEQTDAWFEHINDVPEQLELEAITSVERRLG